MICNFFWRACHLLWAAPSLIHHWITHSLANNLHKASMGFATSQNSVLVPATLHQSGVRGFCTSPPFVVCTPHVYAKPYSILCLILGMGTMKNLLWHLVHELTSETCIVAPSSLWKLGWVVAWHLPWLYSTLWNTRLAKPYLFANLFVTGLSNHTGLRDQTTKREWIPAMLNFSKPGRY